MRPITHVILMLLVSVTVLWFFELAIRSHVFSSWGLLWKTALPYFAVGAAIMLIGLIFRIFSKLKWKTIVTIAWIVMLAVELVALAGVFQMPEIRI